MKKIFIGLLAAALLTGCHTQEGEHAHNPDGSHVALAQSELEA